MDYEINIFNFIKDAALLILSWGLLACAFHSWGGFFAKILNINISGGKRHFANIWLGWCFCLFFFAVYNLFWPVNAFASTIFYGPAITYFFIKYYKKIIPLIKSIDKLKLTAIAFTIIVVAFVGIQLPMNYDSGLYHLDSIRWANELPIVKGLANLHTRHGFNQLYFLYCASLNFHPFLSPYAFHAANTFLYSVFFIGLILSGTAVDLIILCLFFFLPVPYFWLAAPTPDVASCFLQLVAFRAFLEALSPLFFKKAGDNVEKSANRGSLIAFAAVLAAILVTVKLSNAVFALGLGFITLWYSFKHAFEADEKKSLKRTFVFIGIFVAIWIGRAYILSGYPFFPTSVGRINFDWTVPDRLRNSAEVYIYTGARSGGKIWNYDNPVMQDGAWVDMWIKEFFFDETIHLSDDSLQNFSTIVLLALFPMTMDSWGMGCLNLFILALILWVVWLRAIFKHKGVWENTKLYWALFIVEIVAIAFWLIVAPDPRFSNGIFVCMFITCLLMVKTAYPKLCLNDRIKKCMMFYSVIIMIWCFWIAFERNEFRIDGMYVLHGVPLKPFVTNSGLVIQTPVYPAQTWNTTLLETPDPEPGLELRGKSVSDGFRIKE